MFVLSHCPTDSLLIHRRIVWLFPPKCTSYRGMVGEMVGGLVLERWGAVTLFSLAGMAALAGLLFFAILGRSVANVSSATLN